MRRSAERGWFARRAPAIVLRYGLAILSVAAAYGLASLLLRLFHFQTFNVFALSAIAATFWYGGIMPGVVATLLSVFARSTLIVPDGGNLSRAVYLLGQGFFAGLMTLVRRGRRDPEETGPRRTAGQTAAEEGLPSPIPE